MSNDPSRLVVILLLVAVFAIFVAYARGPDHHHGQYVGSLGQAQVAQLTG